MNKCTERIYNGLVKENPTFVLMLGMCPTLAVTTSAVNGIGMGLAATFVLVGSNVIISLIRKFIPNKIRIPCFIVVIATFVTIVDLYMAAFLPDLHNVLGVFVPLIVVNCIILARAEAFAYKNGPVASALDGLGMGLGFTLSLILLSAIREVIGTGVFFSAPDLGFAGIQIFPERFAASILVQPVGGFLVLGLVLTALNLIENKRKAKALKRGDSVA